MALHPVKLPKSAAYLFGIVVLLKRLLHALADPALDADTVNTAWVQNIWSRQDAEWVRKFCLAGQEARIRAIAQAPGAARQTLYDEFCRQNKVDVLLNAGGNFQHLQVLPGFTTQLAEVVTVFFKQCYKLLSTDANRKWKGYEFTGNRSLSSRDYKDDFCCDYPTKAVCPYCDGEIGTPELDHYLCKSSFPLLACSPWNLVPVCKSCNDMVTAKGDRLALTPGPPNSTNDWFHPFFCSASAKAQIRLAGTPQNAIPELYSPDPVEQTRLNNHTGLIRTLGKRWTKKAAAHFDILVRQVNRRLNAANTVPSLVEVALQDHEAERGRAPSSMVYAAVCRAVLDNRSGYIEEFAAPNAPVLD